MYRFRADDTANFTAYTPRKDANWVGRRLYYDGYQTWPRAVPGKLALNFT